MYWNKQSPAVTSSKVNFYYQPSMAEIASMLVSSPGSFNFDYVAQINSDQQYQLLTHFETVHDACPETRTVIQKIIGEIEFGSSARCVFIIHDKNYKKFPTLDVSRVVRSADLLRLANDHDRWPTEIDSIIQSVLLSTGQGTKIDNAVKMSHKLTRLFEANIPGAIDSVDTSNDPVSLARNISKTGASVTPEYYDKLEAIIMMIVLSDDIKVKTQTAKNHMSKIKRAEVKDV